MTRRLLFAAMALVLFGGAPLLAQFDPPPPVPVKPPVIDPARPVAPPGVPFPQPGDPPPFPGGPGFPGPGFPQTNYKEVIPPLIDLMSDTDKETREAACTALARVGRQAVKPLLDILKDKDKDVELRANAAYILGQMGPVAHEAVPDLAKALKDSNRDLRRRAAFALSTIIQDEMHGFPFGGFGPGGGIIGGAGGGFGGPVFPGGGERVQPPRPGDPGVLPPVGKPPIEKPPIEKPPVEKKPIEK